MGASTRGDALNQGKDTVEPNAVSRWYAWSSDPIAVTDDLMRERRECTPLLHGVLHLRQKCGKH